MSENCMASFFIRKKVKETFFSLFDLNETFYTQIFAFIYLKYFLHPVVQFPSVKSILVIFLLPNLKFWEKNRPLISIKSFEGENSHFFRK